MMENAELTVVLGKTEHGQTIKARVTRGAGGTLIYEIRREAASQRDEEQKVLNIPQDAMDRLAELAQRAPRLMSLRD